MKTILVLDRKNYTEDMTVTERYCARGIIRKDGRLAVQRSSAGECKLLGGGMEKGEDVKTALDREIQEEAGMLILYDSVVPVGKIIEKRKDLYDSTVIYECHTEFYLCEVKEERVEVHMTESEIAKGFHLTWVTPQEFVAYNAPFMHYPWIYRDTQFVKYMIRHQI